MFWRFVLGSADGTANETPVEPTDDEGIASVPMTMFFLRLENTR